MRIGMVVASLLALSACGYDTPPRDYRPAERDCGPLLGHWIATEADLAKIAPGLALPPGKTFPFLSIEHDHRGTLELVLRRRPADVLAEAGTLRLTQPDHYRVWRARTLGERVDPELASLVQENAGPMVQRRWQMALEDCDGGWRRGGQGFDVAARPGSDGAGHLAFLALALGENGELLIEHHVRRENISDFVFFGQSIRYYTYAYSAWHRLAPVPAAAVPTEFTAADLPTVPSRGQRLALKYGRDRTLASFTGWLRDNVPAGVVITVLRERSMDPVAMALPPDQVRMELAGHWPIGAPDPFTPLLESNPRVGPVEVKQARLQPDNRPYRLLEFTITVDPALL